MTTIIERARQRAERLYPKRYYQISRPAFVAGATFAATITPEQVEAGMRANIQARSSTPQRPLTDDEYRAVRSEVEVAALIAAARAMGFEVAS